MNEASALILCIELDFSASSDIDRYPRRRLMVRLVLAGSTSGFLCQYRTSADQKLTSQLLAIPFTVTAVLRKLQAAATWKQRWAHCESARSTRARTLAQ